MTRILDLEPPPRVAILVSPHQAWRLPNRWPGLDVDVVVAEEDAWAGAVARAAARAPEVTLALAPDVPSRHVAALPGIRVAVALRSEDAERCPEPGVFHWFTLPRRSPELEARLPVLGLVPPTVDAEALPPPDLGRIRAMVPAWAAPAPEVLARMREVAAVDVLPAGIPAAEVPARLAAHGLFLHCGAPGHPLHQDPVPILAMAAGMLVVTREAFPAEWGIEPGDDHLAWPDARGWTESFARLARAPGSLAPVRVRAWQKVREELSTGPTLSRVILDALLRSSPDRVAGSVARARPASTGR